MRTYPILKREPVPPETSDDDNDITIQAATPIGEATNQGWTMLPREGDGESLKRVAQRDIPTSSGRDHFPLESLARRARTCLARAL